MRSEDIALQVMREAVLTLARWSEAEFSRNIEKNYPAVEKAKETLSWTDNNIDCLRLLFDFVKLREGHNKEYYCLVDAIADSAPLISYPIEKAPDLAEYKQIVKEEIV
ncbi:MAG: hypothetical protein AAFO04_10775 [Cyanobacteria bacterium J06592_8]